MGFTVVPLSSVSTVESRSWQPSPSCRGTDTISGSHRDKIHMVAALSPDFVTACSVENFVASSMRNWTRVALGLMVGPAQADASVADAASTVASSRVHRPVHRLAVSMAKRAAVPSLLLERRQAERAPPSARNPRQIIAATVNAETASPRTASTTAPVGGVCLHGHALLLSGRIAVREGGFFPARCA